MPASPIFCGKLELTATGQVMFSRAVLEHLGAEPGDKLVLDLLPGGRVGVRAALDDGIAMLIGYLVREGGVPVSLANMGEAISAGWAGQC